MGKKLGIREGLISEIAAISERIYEDQAVPDSEARVKRISEYIGALNQYILIDRFLDSSSMHLEEALQEVAEMLTRGWRYPESVCARIVVADKEFRTSNFKQTEWKQASHIKVRRTRVGLLEVGYLGTPSLLEEEPLSEVAGELVNAIARRLGRLLERRQTEEELRISQAQYVELAESITDLFFAFDRDLRYTYWNRASEKLMGIRATDALGKSLFDIFPDNEETRRAAAVYLEVLRTREPAHFLIEYHLAGTDYVFDISVYPLGEGISVFARDVTENRRAQESLRESEEKFRNLAESSPNMIFISRKGRILYCNGQCQQTTGYALDEIYSPDFNFVDLIAPDCRDRALRDYSEHKTDEEMSQYEYTLVTRSGKRIEVMVSTKLILYEREAAILGVVTDITDRKRAEEALAQANEELETRVRKRTLELELLNRALTNEIEEHRVAEKKLQISEERLRRLFESVSDAIAVIDMKGVIVDCNDQAVQLAGFPSKSDMVRRPFLDLVAESDKERAVRNLEAIRDGDESGTNEYMIVRPDGSQIPIEASTRLLFGPSGEAEGFVAIARDLSKLRLTIGKLQLSEERLQRLFESASDGIAVADANGTIVTCNARAAELCGYTSGSEIAGRNFVEFMDPADRPQAEADLEKGRSGQTPVHAEYHIIRTDGSRLPVEVSIRELMGSSEKPEGFVAIVRDISPLKIALEKQQFSEERVRRLFESVADGIAVLDLNGTITDCNDRAVEIAGYSSKDQVMGRPFVDFIDLPDVPRARANLERITGGEAGGYNDYLMVRADGSKIPGEVNTRVLIGPAGEPEGYVAVVRDMSSLAAAMQKVQVSEERMRRLFESASDGISFVDLDGKIVLCNDRAAEICGYSAASEAMGRSIVEFVHPADRDRALEAMQKGRAGDIPEALLEYRLLRKNGGEVPIEASIRGIIGASGALDGFVAVIRDVTERKQAHEYLRALSGRLVEAQEKERRFIARELHDQIGQSLTVLKLLLGKAQSLRGREESSTLNEAEGVLGEVMGQVRALSLDLRPGILDDLGLVPALQWFFKRQFDQTGLRVQFMSRGVDFKLPAEIATAAYRIIQEALTNVLRHSGVKEAAALLCASRNTLHIIVEDKGRGFDPAKLALTSAGISGIRERALLLGGTFEIKSVPGQGTRVEVRIPLQPGATPSLDWNGHPCDTAPEISSGPIVQYEL